MENDIQLTFEEILIEVQNLDEKLLQIAVERAKNNKLQQRIHDLEHQFLDQDHTHEEEGKGDPEIDAS